MNKICLIGIDCAVNPKNTGIAIGYFTHHFSLDQGMLGEDWRDITNMIAERIKREENILLALDAPLGWPEPMGQELAPHQAGAPLKTQPNQLFQRETDRFIHEKIGKKPLDIGANWIAHTAHQALHFLQQLRDTTDKPIPLAWTPKRISGAAAIEVYPAATLKARGLDPTKYKGSSPQAQEKRRKLIQELKKEIKPSQKIRNAFIESDHIFDAALCALAAADFARGNVIAPANLPRAKKEGWIWAKPKDS